MSTGHHRLQSAHGTWYLAALLGSALVCSLSTAADVTLKGSLMCNGACIPDPNEMDHGLVLFAIDGAPEIRME